MCRPIQLGRDGLVLANDASRESPRFSEASDLMARTVYPEIPPRVECALTPLGVTLRQQIRGLVGWAGDHLSEVDAARATYDAQHGPPARASVAERLVAKRRTTARR